MLRVTRACFKAQSVVASVPKVGKKTLTADEIAASKDAQARVAKALEVAPWVDDTWRPRAIIWSSGTTIKKVVNSHDVTNV